ncbi:MAG: ISNCY family transposase, partial [Bacteroidota bacterium]
RTFEEVSAKLKTSMLTTAEQLRAEGMQQGVQQGVRQERIEIAKNMLLAMHMDMDLVQRATGLSPTDLASLR